LGYKTEPLLEIEAKGDGAMNEENRPLLTNESVEVQDFMKNIHHFRGILRIYPTLIKKKMKEVKMELSWTWKSTDYAQKSPRTPG
jgi:hypothetical protein